MIMRYTNLLFTYFTYLRVLQDGKPGVGGTKFALLGTPKNLRYASDFILLGRYRCMCVLLAADRVIFARVRIRCYF